MKHLQFATIKNNLAILKKTYQYDRPLFFLRILMALLTSISVYLSILMPMYVLNAILEGSFSHIISYTVVFTVALLIISYLNQVFAAYDKIHTEVIFAKVTEELLHKSATLDLSYFDDTASYDRYNRAFSNCCNVINGINRAVHGRVAGPQRRFRVAGAELGHAVPIRQKAAAAFGPQSVNHLVEFDAKVMGLELCLVVYPFGIEFPARAEVPLQMADTAGTAVQLLVLVKGKRDLRRPDGDNVKLQNHSPFKGNGPQAAGHWVTF